MTHIHVSALTMNDQLSINVNKVRFVAKDILMIPFSSWLVPGGWEFRALNYLILSFHTSLYNIINRFLNAINVCIICEHKKSLFVAQNM